MNSIMQEASSLAKAIEQAWTKAGKPQKFSIRVFEEAQKNFIGMTTSPAKIALLFEKKDIPSKEQPAPAKKREVKPREHITRRQPKRPEIQPQPKKTPQTAQQLVPLPEKNQEKKTSKPKILWTDEMVSIARNWVRDALEKMGKKGINFSTEVKRYHLKFVLSEKISESQDKQKDIFRNFAHLIMQTVRNRKKKQFKYHKVVLTSDT